MMIANSDSIIGMGSRTIAARVESMTFDPCNADTAKHGLKLSVPDSDLHQEAPEILLALQAVDTKSAVTFVFS